MIGVPFQKVTSAAKSCDLFSLSKQILNVWLSFYLLNKNYSSFSCIVMVFFSFFSLWKKDIHLVKLRSLSFSLKKNYFATPLLLGTSLHYFYYMSLPTAIVYSYYRSDNSTLVYILVYPYIRYLLYSPSYSSLSYMC